MFRLLGGVFIKTGDGSYGQRSLSRLSAADRPVGHQAGGYITNSIRRHWSTYDSCKLRVAMVIKSAKYVISSPDYKQCPQPDRPEYAFIGRSNVGKSSVINMIADNHKLAKTSGSPGKTQLINHFEVESASATSASPKHWYLVDLPGYGFAKVSQSSRRRWEQMIENYLRKRENLVNVFVLIDSRHSPQKLDLDFVDQLGKWQIPFALVFTKTDKETQKEVSKNVKAFLDAMKETWQFLPRHFLTSAVKKTGREKILEFIAESNGRFQIAN